MQKKSPYHVVHSRHITEKARVLEQLQFNNSNPCVKKCSSPKYVFIVDKRANKYEIADAIQQIYAEKNITVVGVNTTRVHRKPRRVRGRSGFAPEFKKAIVTLAPGDALDEKTP